MRSLPIFLLFIFLHTGSAQSDTGSLPTVLGKLTLGAKLPADLFASSMYQCEFSDHKKGICTYDARQPIARMLWRSISSSWDYKDPVADIYVHQGLVVVVNFSFWEMRYPDLVKTLSSKYGKPKIEDILDDDPYGTNLRRWIWRDSNCTLILVAVPESHEQLQNKDRLGVPHVVISYNKLYKQFSEALENYYREQYQP